VKEKLCEKLPKSFLFIKSLSVAELVLIPILDNVVVILDADDPLLKSITATEPSLKGPAHISWSPS